MTDTTHRTTPAYVFAQSFMRRYPDEAAFIDQLFGAAYAEGQIAAIGRLRRNINGPVGGAGWGTDPEEIAQLERAGDDPDCPIEYVPAPAAPDHELELAARGDALLARMERIR